MRQRALDAGVFVIFPILLLGLASCAADDGSAVVENQDVARVAPVCRSAPTDVGDDFAGDALVRPEDEDAFPRSPASLSRPAQAHRQRQARPARLNPAFGWGDRTASPRVHA